MFLIVALSLLLVLHGYVGARFIAPFALGGMPLALYWIVVFLVAIMPLSIMVVRFRGVENDLIDLLLWVGYTSLGLFSLAFVFFLVRDIGWMSGYLFGKFTGLFSWGRETLSGPELDRRQFLIMAMNWGILGLSLLMGIVGLLQARFKPLIQKVELPIRGFDGQLANLRIAQISDLHVGPTIKAGFVQQVVDQVNSLQPDLIFFTGDMVDGSVKRLEQDVEPLRQLKARFGTYFVTGNHEYYSGADHWVEKVRELGMTPLMNEHRILDLEGQKLVLAGVTDLMAHQIIKSHKSDPLLALAGAPKHLPTILLAHQPGTADQVRDLNIDLMVCGHTHGGQYVPFNWAVAKAHKYAAGLYEQDRMWVYVNRGTGYWGPPLRLGIPSEITLFNLIPRG